MEGYSSLRIKRPLHNIAFALRNLFRPRSVSLAAAKPKRSLLFAFLTALPPCCDGGVPRKIFEIALQAPFFKGLIKFFAAVMLFFLLVNTGEVWGRVYIDIESPSSHKFPIAVADLKPLGSTFPSDNLGSWFAQEVSRCLNMTGYFQLIDKRAFLEDQEKAGITADGIHFDDWTVIGAEYLVKGGYLHSGRELSVEFRLFDVVKGEMIVGKRYAGRPEDKQVMVMRFVDEMLLALTGEQGHFDTRIAFVGAKGDTKDIYTINFDGSDIRRVTDYRSLTVVPRWSPDGRSMAFTSYKDGNPDLYLKDMVTGSTKKISSYPGMNIPGCWFRDGRHLLVTLSRQGTPIFTTWMLKADCSSVLQPAFRLMFHQHFPLTRKKSRLFRTVMVLPRSTLWMLMAAM